jgi:hypothetical protein
VVGREMCNFLEVAWSLYVKNESIKICWYGWQQKKKWIKKLYTVSNKKDKNVDKIFRTSKSLGFMQPNELLQGEAKNFDRENLIVQKLTEWFAHVLLSARANAILLQFFLRTLILHTTQNQKAQFPRSIERKCSMLFSLVFPWCND